MDTRRSDRSSRLDLLEGLEVAIEAPLCSWIALRFDFSEESQAGMLPALLVFEHVGSKGIKGTLPLAAAVGFGKSCLLEPGSNRSLTPAQPPLAPFCSHTLPREY